MRRKVVVITDCTDIAFLEIRGAIYSNAFTDDFDIEPIVIASEYSIINTAFLIMLIAKIYPENTLICVVVNPLQLRTERIVGRTKQKNIIFEGTNTGAFGWLIEEYGCEELFEIHDNGFVPFGGKYVHAPAVGKVISGIPLSSLGAAYPVNSVRDVQRDIGTVVHIDNFGNIKFLGKLDGSHNGDKYLIEVNGRKYEAVYWMRMMERENGELVIYPGSSFGFPELGLVRDNAAEKLGIKNGDIVRIEKIIGEANE